jgi:hypothetical protein
MVLGLPLAHIPSYFADDGHCRYDIDAIDLGQVRTGHAKQLFPQVKWWIAFLFPVLALSPAGVFRQSGPWLRSSSSWGDPPALPGRR